MLIQRIRETGFTLVEVALAIAVLSLLAAAIVPVAIRQVEVRFAQRTGREVSLIQDGAKWFYVDQKRWPTSLAELRQGRYLNPAWTGQTPWGQPYALASTPTSFSVSAPVPTGIEGTVEQLVVSPSKTPQGQSVLITSTIPLPGREASLAMLVHKQGDTMTGPLQFANAAGATVVSIDPTSGRIAATGDVQGQRLCIGSQCRAVWPAGFGGLFQKWFMRDGGNPNSGGCLVPNPLTGGCSCVPGTSPRVAYRQTGNTEAIFVSQFVCLP